MRSSQRVLLCVAGLYVLGSLVAGAGALGQPSPKPGAGFEDATIGEVLEVMKELAR